MERNPMIYPWPYDDTNEPNPDEEPEDDSWQDRAYDLWADK